MCMCCRNHVLCATWFVISSKQLLWTKPIPPNLKHKAQDPYFYLGLGIVKKKKKKKPTMIDISRGFHLKIVFRMWGKLQRYKWNLIWWVLYASLYVNKLHIYKWNLMWCSQKTFISNHPFASYFSPSPQKSLSYLIILWNTNSKILWNVSTSLL